MHNSESCCEWLSAGMVCISCCSVFVYRQHEGEETITVTLHADDYALLHLESYPLHPSQRIKETLDEGGVIIDQHQ